MTRKERDELNIVLSRLDTVRHDLLAVDPEDPELFVFHTRNAEATLAFTIDELRNLIKEPV